MSGLIRTLRADVPADEAGPIYVHEHLIIDSPLVAATMSHIHLPSAEEAIAEVGECHAVGVRLMVDAMPAASGRSPLRLDEISRRTGVAIVATTGLHTAKYYDDVPWTRTESPEELAGRFVADIAVGIDRHDHLGATVERTEVRAGIIKVAALAEQLSDRDRRVFAAAAIAHRQTGAPILTHTEGGLGGVVQIDELRELGVDLSRVALSHTDKVHDAAYHRELLSAGVYLCYDQPLRSPAGSADLIEAMVEAGHVDRLLLGTDGARRSLWATLGGSPGLAWLYQGFPRLLQERGLGGVVSRLFSSNPARYLAFHH